MVDLKTLQDSLSNPSRPPLETWNPPFCGDIDIRINSQGHWFYNGSEITRQPLVRLFASVLWQETGEYFLLTPVEKVRIQVDDLPFVIEQWQWVGENPAYIQVKTNVGEEYLVTDQYPLLIVKDLPAIKIRDGFLARVHRNVYYQWAELAEQPLQHEPAGFYLPSGPCRFLLG